MTNAPVRRDNQTLQGVNENGGRPMCLREQNALPGYLLSANENAKRAATEQPKNTSQSESHRE